MIHSMTLPLADFRGSNAMFYGSTLPQEENNVIGSDALEISTKNPGVTLRIPQSLYDECLEVIQNRTGFFKFATAIKILARRVSTHPEGKDLLKSAHAAVCLKEAQRKAADLEQGAQDSNPIKTATVFWKSPEARQEYATFRTLIAQI
jgi:hypothetical protein